MDTSTFTHFFRAGYGVALGAVAPGGIVLVPREVESEIDRARERHSGVPRLGEVTWVERVFMTDDEQWTALQVKAALGGGPAVHLGESAVIACAHHRGLIAVLDERAAVTQAEIHGVGCIDTMRIVALIHDRIFGRDQSRTVELVDALLDTDMWLPVDSGAAIFDS